MAIRSSLVVPPQIPCGIVRRAYDKQFSPTAQRPQIAFAELICSTAAPVMAIGKNSSGSAPRHAPRTIQLTERAPASCRTIRRLWLPGGSLGPSGGSGTIGNNSYLR